MKYTEFYAWVSTHFRNYNEKVLGNTKVISVKIFNHLLLFSWYTTTLRLKISIDGEPYILSTEDLTIEMIQATISGMALKANLPLEFFNQI